MNENVEEKVPGRLSEKEIVVLGSALLDKLKKLYTQYQFYKPCLDGSNYKIFYHGGEVPIGRRKEAEFEFDVQIYNGKERGILGCWFRASKFVKKREYKGLRQNFSMEKNINLDKFAETLFKWVKGQMEEYFSISIE